MAFKFNISEKGKAFKLESDAEAIIGMKIGDKLAGEDVSDLLKGYELEITGASDKAGFPSKKDIEGTTLTRKLLTYGFGMKKGQGAGRRKFQETGQRDCA